MFFERWIAVFRYTSNIGFLICISDSYGYLGSVGVLIYKNFFNYDMDWLFFIKTVAYVAGTVIMAASAAMYFYFQRKEKKSMCAAMETEKNPAALPREKAACF